MPAYSISVHGNSSGDFEYNVDWQSLESEDEKEEAIQEAICFTRMLVEQLTLKKVTKTSQEENLPTCR